MEDIRMKDTKKKAKSQDVDDIMDYEAIDVDAELLDATVKLHKLHNYMINHYNCNAWANKKELKKTLKFIKKADKNTRKAWKHCSRIITE